MMAGKDRCEGESMPLVSGLRRLGEDPGERWHTPGHKGRLAPDWPLAGWPWDRDVTEVGAIWEWVGASEARLAAQVGARRSWYSVQGATLAVMAAVLAATPPGGRIAVERHAHRSVMQAVIVGDLEPLWIDSTLVMDGGVPLPAREAALHDVLERADTLLLTRPTYDGIALADASVRRLTAYARGRGKNVVVDEAHGAHWGGRPGFPRPALDLGADLVAQGVHKTEPTLTQTAVLHLSPTSPVAERDIETWWRLLATSSPSYLLLASLDEWQAKRGEAGRDRAWRALSDRMRAYWGELADRGFRVLQAVAEADGFQADPAKLTLIGPGVEWARQIQRFGTVEKADARSVTFIMAPEQSMARLDDAIRQLRPAKPGSPSPLRPPPGKALLRPRAAFQAPTAWVPLGEGVGRIATRDLTPYPPGIPWLVPGEVIPEAMVSAAMAAIRADPAAWAGAPRIDGELVVGVMRE